MSQIIFSAFIHTEKKKDHHLLNLLRFDTPTVMGELNINSTEGSQIEFPGIAVLVV
jgi:hypothetical protein